jgi:hypothetical protein
MAQVILGINPIAHLADTGAKSWINGIGTQNSPRLQCGQYIGMVGGPYLAPGMMMRLPLSNVG